MLARVLAIAVTLSLVGCEKTDHDNIDKWMRTEKGPGKLKKALVDEGIDADLSAHAAMNLIKAQEEPHVRSTLEAMSPGRRTQVIGKLAERLWKAARVEDPMKLPQGPQIQAKDSLVTIRKWADDSQKQQIDGYLLDWYAVSSYEGRANQGASSGASVMRLVGPAGAKRMVAVLNSVIAAPGQTDTVKNRIGDELMLAVAATGSPESVGAILDIVKLDRGDESLPKRAMTVLYRAYVDPGGDFDIVSPEPLAPNLDKIVTIAKDDTQVGEVVNIALDLIRVTGTPQCFKPLLSMIGVAHKVGDFRYVVANKALVCGGNKSIVEVVTALPTQGAYDLAAVYGSIASEIAKMSPRDKVQTALRELLGHKSTIAKWVAIEALSIMKSEEDKPKIAQLTGNRDRLVGYHGKNPLNLSDPTLGDRAKEVVAKFGNALPPK
ncbi:MAG: hypothetical protein WKG01_06465 [Kofleriaceae bacterium]